MSNTSPPWGPTVKLVVGLTFVAIIAGLLVRFRVLVGPLLLAIIVAYLLHPLISFISQKTPLSWRASVNIIYLIFVLVLLGLLAASGVAVIQQTQNLFRLVDRFITDLPNIVQDLSTRVFVIGPFELDMVNVLGETNLDQLLNQIVGLVQPVIGRAGSLIGSIASGTFSTLGWMFFILLVSYFVLADAGQVPDVLSGLVANIRVPGYQEDFSRLGRALGRIWNAFLRGQFILFAVTVLVAFLMLTLLGVRNAMALALIAGLARFVPYIGPFITWLVTGVVAFFQTSNYLGLDPLTFSLVVVGLVVIWDQIIDNLVTPRLYGQVLGVHPAAVLIAAIIAANLLGLIGLLLAAPVLATLMLFWRYASRKMFDMDPWPEEEEVETTGAELPGSRWLKNGRVWLAARLKKRNREDEPEPPST